MKSCAVSLSIRLAASTLSPTFRLIFMALTFSGAGAAALGVLRSAAQTTALKASVSESAKTGALVVMRLAFGPSPFQMRKFYLRYCSSVTFSIQSTFLPFSVS